MTALPSSRRTPRALRARRLLTASLLGALSGCDAPSSPAFTDIADRSSDARIIALGLNPPPLPKVSDRFAYALLTNGAMPIAQPYAVPAKYAFNAKGGAITINRLGTGVYNVRVGGMAAVVPRDLVLVMTYGGSSARCVRVGEADSGADVVVWVRCGLDSRTLMDAPFALLLAGAGALPGKFAYAAVFDSDSTTPLHSYSRRGGVHVTGAPGNGSVVVDFRHAPPLPVSGVYLTSPFGTDGGLLERICTMTWDASDAQGWCTNARSGALADADQMVALVDAGRPGAGVAYAESGGPTPTLAAGRFYNSAGGAVTVTRRSVGQYDVRFAGLAASAKRLHPQASAVGARVSHACNVALVTTSGADALASVVCRDWRRVLTDSKFSVLLLE